MLNPNKLRCGISEIISVSILLLISIISSVIIFNFANTSFQTMIDDYEGQVNIAKNSIEGRILVSSIYRDKSSNNIIVYIYNYGPKDITLDKVYINGKNENYTPSNLLIPTGEITSIQLLPSIENNGHLTIVTKNNNRYETYYEI